jgi:hypothetical protein
LYQAHGPDTIDPDITLIQISRAKQEVPMNEVHQLSKSKALEDRLDLSRTTSEKLTWFGIKLERVIIYLGGVGLKE